MNKFWSLILLSLCYLCGCGSGTEKILAPSSETGNIMLNVTWPQDTDVKKRAKTNQQPIIFLSSYFTAYLYSSSGKEITRIDLIREENRAKGEIKVVADNDYRLELIFSDLWSDGDVVAYVGLKEGIDVVAGDTTSVDITMVSAAPTLFPANIISDNSFTLSWSSVPIATSYSLGEDTAIDFFSATTVYSGPEVTLTLTDKSTGVYYYGVYAETPYGITYTSEPMEVEVGDIAIIVIDVPWPRGES